MKLTKFLHSCFVPLFTTAKIVPGKFAEKGNKRAKYAARPRRDVGDMYPKSRARRLDSQTLLGCIKSRVCLSVRFVVVASPPVQASNTGLKMREV